jgi:uncharacterized protein with NRDE domain
MCTLALYFRIFEDYPLVVAANRDEHYDRPSLTPHLLASSPKILAGTDLRAGGTWLGVNEYGMLAAVLNRRANGDQSPPSKTRSRGLLCLDLLTLRTASEARGFLTRKDEEFYQPFSLVFADPNEAWVAFNSNGKIERMSLSQGLHVFSSAATHNERSEKRERAYTLFSGLLPSLNSTSDDISSWTSIFANVLSDHMPGNHGDDPKEAICVHTDVSGTVSSSIIVYSRSERRFRTFFCAGPPCRNSFAESPSLNVQ